MAVADSPKAAASRWRTFAVLLVISLALIGLACGGASSSSAKEGLPGRSVPDEGRQHVNDSTPITYKNNPPASGSHYPRWINYGVYEEVVPEGYWVHNLEHGTVVLLYKCQETDCSAKATQIRLIYDTLPKGKYGAVKFVGARYDKMQQNYALVAWDRIDEMDALDADRVTKFYTAFVDKGPEDVP